MNGLTQSSMDRTVLPAVGGGLLAAYGLRRGSWLGTLCVAAGGWLVYYGVKNALCSGPLRGRCGDLSEKAWRILEATGAGVNAGTYDQLAQAVKEERTPAGEYIEDVVDEASDDSFPASDPPAWAAR